MAGRVRDKEFRYPVEIRWDGGRRVIAHVDGKQAVAIATPPEFRGTDPELWSPEDAFVAAASACLGVTFAALAEREQLPVHGFSVNAVGVVGRRPDGRFGFVRIDQTVVMGTNRGHEDAARALVAQAEESCLISSSIDLPVVTDVDIRTEEMGS